MGQSIRKTIIKGFGVSLAAVLLCCSLATSPAHAQTVLAPQSLGTAGVYALRDEDPSLTGQGVRVAVVSRAVTYRDGQTENDYQPNVTHRSLAQSDIAMHDDGSGGPGVSFHSTAVCSILFGQDSGGYTEELGSFRYQGIVPEAQADVYELWHFISDVVVTQQGRPPDVLSMSCGWDFEDWYTRGIDALVEHQGVLGIASIGNGTDAFQGALYPGASANMIGVGVVDSVDSLQLETVITHFGLARPEHSSCGPTRDRRSKPDLVAPGNCLVAGADDPNAYDLTGNASSYAAPVVAGVAGLLVQKARQQPDLDAAVSPEGGNCVIKALLMNSAVKLPFWHKGALGVDDDHLVPLDYAQGAGMVNGLEAYRQLTAGRQEPGSVSAKGWDLNELLAPETMARIYELTVDEPNEDFITATLVWNRHYASDFPFQPTLDEDQDLAVELWAVDPNDPGRDVRLDYSDSPDDNVEHIHAKSLPGFTRYQLIVLLNPPDPVDGVDRAASEQAWERYALAWSVAPPLPEGDIRWRDLNGDGIVDAADVQYLEDILDGREWDMKEGYVIGDVNTDGSVDSADVAAVADQGGRRAEWYRAWPSQDR